MKLSPSLLNHTRARQVMTAHGLDALIAASPENVTYACGFHSLSPYVLGDTQVFGLVPAATPEAAALVIPRGELTYVAARPAAVEDIRVYGDTTLIWSDDRSYGGIEDDTRALMQARPVSVGPVEALVGAIGDYGLQKARIGLDERGILPENLQSLSRLLPQAELVDAFQLWRTIRAVKTPLEVERLRRAATINEEALADSLAAVKAGVTNAELHAIFQQSSVRRGGLPRYWDSGLGTQAALFTPPVSGYQARPGDLARLDGVSCRDHYWADTGRTAVLKPRTPKQETYYAALLTGIQAGMATVRPGARPSFIFESIMHTVKAAGIPHYVRFHTGHGLGLEFYELPGIRPRPAGSTGDSEEEACLEEGMVLNLETPYYELGFGGLQIEDTLLVTASGYEPLTHRTRELVTL